MRILAQLVGGIVLASLFAYGCVKCAEAINKLWEIKNANRIDTDAGDAEQPATSDGKPPADC